MHQIALGHRHHSNVVIEDLKTAHRSNTSAGTSRPAAPNITIHLQKLRSITTGSVAHTNTQIGGIRHDCTLTSNLPDLSAYWTLAAHVR